MDTEKCRTCFANLERNDLYLKLNIKHKSSRLSLLEKLRLCVPAMDIRDADNSCICMQCTMHLEAAYTFHMTCMEAEEKFREQCENSNNNEKKKAELVCKACNISFSTKKIFDLHNKVMHNQKDDEDEEIIGFRKSEKGKRDKFQMVFLEDNRTATSSEKSFEGNTSKNDEVWPERRSKRRTVPRNNYSELNDSFGYDLYEEPLADTSFTEIGVRKSKKRKRGVSENEDIKPDIEELPIDIGGHVEEPKNDKIRESEKFINCRFCGKKFLEKNLMNHIGKAHKERCSRCLLCKRYYTNYKMHRKIYGCQLQNVSENNEFVDIQNEQGQNETIYYIAVDNNLYMCIICWKKCRTIQDLEKHISAKHNDHFQCRLCMRRMSGFKYCAHVGQGCPKLGANSYFRATRDGHCSCPLCKKPYSKKLDLRAHLSCHLFSKLECVVCETTFPVLRKYLDHVYRGCSKTKPAQTETVLIKTTDDERLPKNEISDEYPSSSTDVSVHKLKIEETELLDRDGTVLDDSLIDKGSSDMVQVLNGECIDGADSVNVDVDEPDLIYIVPED